MTDGAFEIREYSPDGHDELISLWRLCGLVRPWNDPDADIMRKMQVAPELFLIGLKEGRIIASVMGGYEGHRAWINYLAVHPEHRRNGYGRAMMQAVEQRLYSKGAPKINLQIRSENTDVKAFYESIGFKTDDVISMGKRLVNDEDDIKQVYTDGKNADFIELCGQLDLNLDEIVGGAFQRDKYDKYNQLDDIHDAIVLYSSGVPAACGSFKYFSHDTAEIKRVFVRKEYRGRGLAVSLLRALEQEASEKGYRRLILETGRPLEASMGLYRKIGFEIIPNYGQYRDMPDSVCMAKSISVGK